MVQQGEVNLEITVCFYIQKSKHEGDDSRDSLPFPDSATDNKQRHKKVSRSFMHSY